MRKQVYILITGDPGTGKSILQEYLKNLLNAMGIHCVKDNIEHGLVVNSEEIIKMHKEGLI